MLSVLFSEGVCPPGAPCNGKIPCPAAEKETKCLGEGHYRIKLKYRASDETEMLIRILSFGPVLRVTQPESIAELLRGRIERQLELQERK